MYLLLDENKRVKEIISDIDPLLPNISIDKRYPKEFIDELVYISDDLIIEEGYKFNEVTQLWEYADAPILDIFIEEELSLLDRVSFLEKENNTINLHLAESDEIAIELYEAGLAQEAINAEQDEAIIDIYELMEAMNNG